MTEKVGRMDNKQERELTIALIMSDMICDNIIAVVDSKVLKVSYLKKIIDWIKLYYNEYKKAPKQHIQDIFEMKKKELSDAESLIIAKFLSVLSSEYEEYEEFNEEYLLDKCMRYLDERSLIHLSEKVDDFVKSGRIDKAKSLVVNYRSVSKVTSRWKNPFDIESIGTTLKSFDDSVFQYKGPLGELVGPFLRGYFVAVLGPIKRGKSFWLLDTALQAVRDGRKVAFFSFEMDERRMNQRIYKNILSTSKGGEIIYPCFDCYKNQVGTCGKKERENDITLYEEDESKPKFSRDIEYKPCSWCRENDQKEYEPETWFVLEERPKFNLVNVKDKIGGFSKMFGNKFRLKVYPRFSASMSDIRNDLDLLEGIEGFVPDMIFTDYIDILRRGEGEFRHMVDELWMQHAQLASEKRCVVITATQAKMISWDKKSVKASHSSENYRNPAHVDVMLSLNQTPEEKRQGIMRIAVVAHRDIDYNENKFVTVLQQLQTSQVIIDSVDGEIE